MTLQTDAMNDASVCPFDAVRCSAHVTGPCPYGAASTKPGACDLSHRAAILDGAIWSASRMREDLSMRRRALEDAGNHAEADTLHSEWARASMFCYALASLRSALLFHKAPAVCRPGGDVMAV